MAIQVIILWLENRISISLGIKVKVQLIKIICNEFGIVQDVVDFCIDVQESIVKFEGFIIEEVNSELAVSLMLCYNLIIFQRVGFQFNYSFW